MSCLLFNVVCCPVVVVCSLIVVRCVLCVVWYLVFGVLCLLSIVCRSCFWLFALFRFVVCCV